MKKIARIALYAMLILSFCQCKKSGPSKKKTAMVTTIAGSGEMGYTGGSALLAKFDLPSDVVVAADGSLYISDNRNHRIRKLAPDGIVYSFAGDGTYGVVNGNVSVASFRQTGHIALDAAGDVYVLDFNLPQVRKIAAGTNVSVIAGSGASGFGDGPALNAHFKTCWSIAIAADGAVYIADMSNHRIRKIKDGQVSTVAGTGVGGYLDGNVTQAQLNAPRGIAFDKQGNLFVCDYSNFRIRKISPTGVVSTFAGSGQLGAADGDAGTAEFGYLNDMVIDKQGNLYVADAYRVRKITPQGEVTTIAGGSGNGYEDGEGTVAKFEWAEGLGIDAAGNIYVADGPNHRIRKITFQ
jgi:sugar lactone lactonase YvrE